jgi:hypothetical protein
MQRTADFHDHSFKYVRSLMRGLEIQFVSYELKFAQMIVSHWLGLAYS